MTEDERYVAYRDAIRRRVCSPCLDGRGDGSCGLTGRTCALEAHLPAILETIMNVDSERMVDYVVAIEARVCGKCEQRGSSGECRLRDSGDCALAAYLSLVVDAVEEVRGVAT